MKNDVKIGFFRGNNKHNALVTVVHNIHSLEHSVFNCRQYFLKVPKKINHTHIKVINAAK